MTARTRMRRKEVDDVLGGDEMWKHADSTASAYPALSSGSVLTLVGARSRVPDVRPPARVLLPAPDPLRG